MPRFFTSRQNNPQAFNRQILYVLHLVSQKVSPGTDYRSKLYICFPITFFLFHTRLKISSYRYPCKKN